MLEAIYNLLSSRTFIIVGAWLGLLVTIVFVAMVAPKKNRDERGWKILGKASIIAFIYFFFLLNAIAKITGAMASSHIYDIGYHQCANIVQWVYDTVFMVEIAAVFILRKFE